MLLRHMIAGNERFVLVAQGEPIETRPSLGSFDGDDASARVPRLGGRGVRGVARPGCVERPVRLPFGEVPGEFALAIHTVETIVHGWDIAKATGQPTEIEPELFAVAWEAAKDIGEELRGPAVRSARRCPWRRPRPTPIAWSPGWAGSRSRRGQPVGSTGNGREPGDPVAVDVVPGEAADHDLAVVLHGDVLADVGEAEEVDGEEATVGETGSSSAPSALNRATAKLGLMLWCRPGDDDRCRPPAAAAALAVSPWPLMPRSAKPSVPKSRSGSPSASRRTTRNSVGAAGQRRRDRGDLGADEHQPAVGLEREIVAGQRVRQRHLSPGPEAAVGLAVGQVAGDVGVMIDADAVAAGVAARAADDDGAVGLDHDVLGLVGDAGRSRS